MELKKYKASRNEDLRELAETLQHSPYHTPIVIDKDFLSPADPNNDVKSIILQKERPYVMTDESEHSIELLSSFEA